jgi:thiamine-phosphate pyrophosphorylase
MQRFRDAGIYLVTSASLSSGRTTPEIVKSALYAGIRLVQLREKNLQTPAFLDLARELREMTDQCGAILIVNDRLDVAMACKADGVHLGQEDFPVAAARRLAPDLIVGASSHNIEEAVAAQRAGASYVNIGPLFTTQTKEWTAGFLGIEGLDRIRHHVSIPFTVMGGIKPGHIPNLVNHGARTIAVVTAITAAPDPGQAAGELLRVYREALSESAWHG